MKEGDLRTIGTLGGEKALALDNKNKELIVEVGLEPRSPNNTRSISLLCPVTLFHLSRIPESNWVEENIGRLFKNRAKEAKICFLKHFHYWAPTLQKKGC